MHIKAQTEIIMYHRFSDDFAAAKKCDVQTRACDKTKPNLYNPMRTIIVQRKKSPFSAKSPKNRYQINSKIAADKNTLITYEWTNKMVPHSLLWVSVQWHPILFSSKIPRHYIHIQPIQKHAQYRHHK